MAFEFDPASAKLVDDAAAGFDPSTAEPVKPSGALRKLADKAVGFGSGAVGATKAIADVAGADNVVSSALDTANQGLNSLLSPEAIADQQAQQAIMAEANGKGLWEGVKAGARAFSVAPVQTAVTGLGSVVPTVAAGLATGGASVPASLAAMGAIGLAQGAGTVKGAIYDDVLQRSLDAGKTPEEAHAAATQAQEFSGPNAGNIAIGAGLGAGDALTGVSKAATSAIRRMASKAALAEGSTRGVVARTGLGIAGEVPLEVAQGGQEKYAANVAAAREGFEVDPMEGVAAQGTLEGLASAGPGAAFGAFNKAPAKPAAPPAGPMTRALNATTSLGASPGPAPASTATPPEAPDFTTSQGAQPPREGGVDFERDINTDGLSLTDPAEEARIRAATVDFERADQTPNWDTTAGAAPVREGIDMPAPEFDTSGLEIQREGGPLTKAANNVPAAPAGGAVAAPAPLAEVDAPAALSGPKALPAGEPSAGNRIFKNRMGAARAAREAGMGYSPVQVEGGWAVRRGDVTDVEAKEPNAQTRETPALAAPAAPVPAPAADPVADAGQPARGGAAVDAGADEQPNAALTPEQFRAMPEAARLASRDLASLDREADSIAASKPLNPNTIIKQGERLKAMAARKQELLAAGATQEGADLVNKTLAATPNVQNAPSSERVPPEPPQGKAPPAVGGKPAAAPAVPAAGKPGKVETAGVKPLSVGMLPNTAEPVTVKNGIVHIGKDEAINFDTGEPVRVEPGSTHAQIKQALKDAGAISRRQKFYGGQDTGTTAAPEAHKDVPQSSAPTNETTTEVRSEAKADRNGTPSVASENQAAQRSGQPAPDTVESAAPRSAALPLREAATDQPPGDGPQAIRGSTQSDSSPDSVRPANWRSNFIAASQVAKKAGIPFVKGRKLADLVAMIDAKDGATAADDLHPESFAGSIKNEIERREAAENKRRATAVKRAGKSPAAPAAQQADDEVFRALPDGKGSFILDSGESIMAGNGDGTPRRFKTVQEAHDWAKQNGVAIANTPAPTPEQPPAPATEQAGAVVASTPEKAPEVATHKDPGEPAEAATKPVVAEALKKGAANSDRSRADMRADLLAQIDAAAKETPNYADYLAVVAKDGKARADELFTSNKGHRNFGAEVAKGKERITFDIDGDGKFSVTNSYAGLMAFRAKVEGKDSGFQDKLPGRKALPASTSVKKGSANQIAAVESMLEEGDLQAAKDYMEAVGLSTEGLSKSALSRMEQLEGLGEKAQETLYTRIDPKWDYGRSMAARQATLVRIVGKDRFEATVTGAKDALGKPDDFKGGTFLITKNGKKVAEGSSSQFQFTLASAQQQMDSLAPESAAPVEPTVDTPQVEPTASAPAKSGEKIEDFGEKLEGARKDYAATLKDAMEQDVATVPLSKSWPEPDYDKLLASGADPFVVAFIHAARDEIPTKPQSSWKVKRWVQSVNMLRDMASKLLSGETSPERLKETLAKDDFRTLRENLGGRAELYQRVGHAQSLKGVRVTVGEYGLYKGVEYKPPKVIWTVEKAAKASAFSNWPNELAAGSTREEAIKAFAAKVKETPDTAGKKVASFDLWRENGKIHLGKKIGREYITLKTFTEVKAARAYRDANLDELTAALEKYRSTPFERKGENAPRIGEDHRGGARMTPEVFAETFGFRGVQFGNYVENSKRQQDLNDAYDSLMDMAAVLGVPPKALSLNGQLGLAFGARGKGGINTAAAHFESDKVVINLTKNSGAGSLAHEWFHAVDNYFAKLDGGKGGMMTEGAVNPAVRAEMLAAFKKIQDTIKASGMRERSRNLDKRRNKPYWSTYDEMAARSFESYIIAKLQDQNAANDYLANVVSEQFWQAQDAMMGHEGEQTYPYPTEAEMGPVREAFGQFFDAVETKETDAGVAMFSKTEFKRDDLGRFAPGMTPTAIDAAVSELTRDWLRKPEIRVLDSMDDAPADILKEYLYQRSLGSTGIVKAVHQRGTVFLVADAINDAAEVQKLLFHESLGHFGLRGYFGKALNPALEEVVAKWKFRVAKKAREYGLDMAKGADRLLAAEEVLAELAQTRPELDIVQRVVAIIRTWLREHVPGFQNLALTDAEVIEKFILPARGFVERGRSGKTTFTTAQGATAQASMGPRTIQVDGKRYPAENANGGAVSRLNKVMRAAGWEVEYVDMDLTAEKPTANIRINRDDGRFVIAKVDSIGRASFETFQREQSLRMDSSTRGRRPLSPMVDDVFLGRQKFEGARSMLRGMVNYLSDNATNPVALADMRAAWAGVMAAPVQQDAAALPAPDDDDRVQFSKKVMAGATNRQYTPDQLAAMDSVGFRVDQPSLKERAQALWQDAGKKLAQGIVDQFAPVKDLDKQAYGLLRLAKGASGAFEAFLRGGQLKLTDNVYDFDDTKRGGVVDKLLIPLQGEHHDFMRWVAANRAERLLAEGKENLFTPAAIAGLKTLSAGQLTFDYTLKHGTAAGSVTRDRAVAYRDSLVTFNEFNKNALDMAEQSGLIDAASRHLWEHEFYVPFYRVADDADGGIRGMNIKGSVVRQQAFKQLKGGKNALNADLLDNTLMNWAHLLDAAAKNRAAKATLEAAERMGVAIEAPQYTANQIGAATGNKNGVVWFMDGGQKRFFVVDDPYVLTAVSALEFAGMRSPVMNAMGAFKHVLTVGVTASPFFKVRNLIRDSVQVIGTGNISYNPAGNIAQGWKLTDPKSDAYFRLMAGGGTIHFGTMLEGSEAKRIQALVESGVDDSTILNSDAKVKAFYRKFIEPGITAYNELGNRGEAVNRAALYAQLRAQGVDHADASLQARDLMDFSMQGSFTSVRFLTQVVPFMNARLQGTYKLGRAAKENPARFSAVLGAAALMSLGLLAAYSDDDDWKKREMWDRQNFWWFKFGGTAFRIPKPFEIGAIATLAEHGAELMFDDEMTGKRFRQAALKLVGDNLSMNPVPQLVKPVLDVYANTNSFTGRPIESMGMEKLLPEYRFNDRTSMAARGASTAINAAAGLVGGSGPSPVQIDHLLRGYFGWLGSFVVGAGDVIARPATGQNSHPTPDYWKAATGGMVSDLSDAPSRYVSQMYEQAKEIEQAYGTWRSLQKEGKTEEAAAFRQDNPDIAKQPQLARIKRGEAFMNQQIKRIERSDLPGDVKRERIRVILERKDRLARSAG